MLDHFVISPAHADANASQLSGISAAVILRYNSQAISPSCPPVNWMVGRGHPFGDPDGQANSLVNMTLRRWAFDKLAEMS